MRFFQHWRPTWETSDPRDRDCANADVALELRDHGAVLELPAPVTAELQALLKSIEKASPIPFDEMSRLLPQLQQASKSVRFVRWEALDSGLAAASSNGDGLSAALMLRQLIEELRLLKTLARLEAELAAADTSYASEVESALVSYYDLNASRLFGFRTVRSVSLDRDSDDMHKHFAALNDYVHPNYGSHVYALWPEASAAAGVLARSAAAIYAASREYTPPRLEARFDAEPDVRSDLVLLEEAQRASLALEDAFVGLRFEPAVVRALLEDEVGRVREWSSESSWSNWLEALRPLCELLERQPLDPSDVSTFPANHAGQGLPNNQNSWMLMGLARHIAEELDGVAQILAGVVNEDRWEALNRLTAFSGLVASVKASLMRTATLRYLSSGNVLASVICARSLVEHMAVAIHVSERFEKAWKLVEDSSPAHHALYDKRLDSLGVDVARFLSGTKGTEEAIRPWREALSQQADRKHVGIRVAVNAAFPTDSLLGQLYAEFSDGMRGSIVPLHVSETGVASNAWRARVILAVAAAAAPEVFVRTMRHLKVFTGPLSPTSPVRTAGDPKAARRQIASGTMPEELRQDIDYFGSGTAADPFRFRDELKHRFHDMCHAIIDHFGLEVELWAIWLKADGGPGSIAIGPGAIDRPKSAPKTYFLMESDFPLELP